jgi:tetratricopeptide (TPR) repeat protein
VRGTLAMQLMRPEDALRDLQRAVALNPNSRDAYSRLGLLHLVSGEPRAALENYTSATALDPLDDYLHAQRCFALQDLARFEEANTDCAAARALAPDSRWAYSASSSLADAQGRVDEALRWNNEAMNHSPADADLYAERGKWQLTLGLAQVARATYQRGAEALAGDAEALDNLAELGFLTALATDGTKALRTQVATTNLATASTRTLLDAANAQLMAGDAQSARKLVDRALARSTYDAEVTRNAPWDARQGFSYALIAAYTYLNTGNAAMGTALLQKTAALLDRMVAAGTERHGVYLLKADLAALRGDADGAMRALTHASQLGWRNAWGAEREPFLDSVKGRSDYQALIKRVSTANESMSRRVSAVVPATPSSQPH